MAPKVTIHHEPKKDTPSQAIINNANTVQTVADESGRQIGVRKMKALERLRMFEVIGAENAKNEPYMGYAALAFHVCAIGGENIRQPSTKLQLEGLIQQLGDDGMDAVGKALVELYGTQPTQEEAIEQIKN